MCVFVVPPEKRASCTNHPTTKMMDLRFCVNAVVSAKGV